MTPASDFYALHQLDRLHTRAMLTLQARLESYEERLGQTEGKWLEFHPNDWPARKQPLTTCLAAVQCWSCSFKLVIRVCRVTRQEPSAGGIAAVTEVKPLSTDIVPCQSFLSWVF